MTRRDFFKSFKLTKKPDVHTLNMPVRPPYSAINETFELCLGCPGSCASICPTKVIVIQEDKTPHLDYHQGGCVFCGDCAKACDKGVLTLSNPSEIRAIAHLDTTRCEAWNQIPCDSCIAICEPMAILFYAKFNPKIDLSSCTACGFCVKACHDRAMSVLPS
ncbi:MAG: 4Fe-4S dicluster domain-containing protein [Spirochaetota bacterium]|nr:4Fe-4S dicluster domain-containing protein [Spirochaetota bacterium]